MNVLHVCVVCKHGEIFVTFLQKYIDEVIYISSFYDYLEIQPPANYQHLIEIEIVQNEAQIIYAIKNVVELGNRANKPVVATGNLHYIRSEEHTSELQSRGHLVCRLLLEKKKNNERANE